MTESEIWEVIQTGNEISVMRTEVFITITVGVLIISTIEAIKFTKSLLFILLGTYLIFGYINFTMLIAEMEILASGINQIRSMVDANQDVSYMGHYLASQANAPTTRILIPLLQTAFWIVTVSTISYSIWRYIRSNKNS